MSNRRIRAVIVAAIAFCVAAAFMAHFRWVQPNRWSWGAASAGEYPALTAAKVLIHGLLHPTCAVAERRSRDSSQEQAIPGAPEGVRLWRMMYMSNNNKGNPVAVTGYYAEPTLPPAQSNRYPLVGMAHGTTGVGRKCGMSQAPLESGTPGNEYWNTIVEPLTQAGYAVAVTDYGDGRARNSHLPREGCPGLRCARRYEGGDWIPPQVIDTSRLGIIGHSGVDSPRWRRRKPSRRTHRILRCGVSRTRPGLIPQFPAALGALVAGSDDQGGASPRTGYLAVLGWSWAATYPDQIKLDQIFTPEGCGCCRRRSNSLHWRNAVGVPGKLSDYIRTDLPQSMVTIAAANMPVNGVSRMSRCSSSKVTGHQCRSTVDEVPTRATVHAKVEGRIPAVRQRLTDRFSGRAGWPTWTGLLRDSRVRQFRLTVRGSNDRGARDRADRNRHCPLRLAGQARPGNTVSRTVASRFR